MKSDIEPVLVERANDLGWFAKTPTDYPLKFAVEGPTPAEARARFLVSLAHWESIGSDRPVKRKSE